MQPGTNVATQTVSSDETGQTQAEGVRAGVCSRLRYEVGHKRVPTEDKPTDSDEKLRRRRKDANIVNRWGILYQVIFVSEQLVVDALVFVTQADQQLAAR